MATNKGLEAFVKSASSLDDVLRGDVHGMKIKIKRETIEPKNRKLNGNWTIELDQDVTAETQIESNDLVQDRIEYDREKYIYATVLVADQPTINGTVYSKEVVEQAIEKFNARHGIVADESIMRK